MSFQSSSTPPAWTVTERVLHSPGRATFAGVAGATTLLLFHGFVDLLAGPLLYTPSVMASVLFRGDIVSVGLRSQLLMVAAYTLLHVSVFVGLANLVGLFLRMHWRRLPKGIGAYAVLWLGLFVPMEAFMTLLATTVEPTLFELLSRTDVLVGNALGAAVMSVALVLQQTVPGR